MSGANNWRWSLIGGAGSTRVVDHHMQFIADCNSGFRSNDFEHARLIAVAPELLNILIDMEQEKSEYMLKNNLGDPAKEHTNRIARALIAQATGRASTFAGIPCRVVVDPAMPHNSFELRSGDQVVRGCFPNQEEPK